tara:strand:+ start:2050 stop:3963 length:1914 start_codon:yes stop_codon:yes gene_type:complete
MSQKVLNKVNNDIFSYDTSGGVGVFKMSRVMPTEIHHATGGIGTSGYILTSTGTSGNGWTWSAPSTTTSSGPALLDGNIESIDFTQATISGTNVEIDGSVIGTTVGTGVAVSETGGVSTTEASYVDLNMSTGFEWTSNFTLEFYFKMPGHGGNSDPQNYNGLFASFNGTAGATFGDYLVVERRGSANGIHFYTTLTDRNSYNTLYTESTVAGFDGTWGHIVLTNDSSQSTASQKQMYVNGVLFTTGVQNVGSQVNFATGARDHYWVGRNGFGTTYENGVENLKIFRVYNRILTAEEAATLYENRDGTTGGASSGGASSGGATYTGGTGIDVDASNVISTDSTIVNTTSNQYIDGLKNFSNNVSIGLTAANGHSAWPLRVGGTGIDIAGQLYLYAHDGGNWGWHGQYWVSHAPYYIGLFVDHGIRAARMYFMSDRRIKKDIVDIQDDEALRKLRTLKPKRYKYIDPRRGTQEVYGFIAQEVGEVIPYSVKTEKSFLPSHMCFCKITGTYEDTSVLNMNISHDLVVNDVLSFRNNKDIAIENVKVIEIIDDKTIKIDKVFTTSETILTAITGETENDMIYLYGKEIPDLHILNKDSIWTTATAALQEVDRQLQAEKIKNLNLTSRLEALEARITSLEAK